MAKEIFGIELEVPLKDGVTIDQFRECLVSALGSDLVHTPSHGRLVAYHSDEYDNAIDLWRVASDSSLNDFCGRGVEIVSRRRTSLKETKKAMEATRHLVDLELLARTRSGGHHVHIGILHFSAIKRSYDPEDSNDLYKLLRTKRVKLLEIKISEVYAYFQPVINAIVSRSRRTDSGRNYNRAINAIYLNAKDNPTGRQARQKEEHINDSRSPAPFMGNRGVVNFGMLSSYGTVEYRQHQQTYNVATVQNWVKLMHRITSRCWVQETKNIDPSDYPVSVDGFSDFLGLGGNRLRDWMRRRANHFNYNVIARIEGVRPSVGLRVRDNQPLPDRESTNIESVIADIESVRNELSLEDRESANTELTESLLILENDYNSYHRIRNTVFEYQVANSLSLTHARSIIQDELINHSLPTSLFNVNSVLERFRTIVQDSHNEARAIGED
jgi:hypothetical protein